MISLISIYAASSLVSQAVMSVGAALVAAGGLWRQRPSWSDYRSFRDYWLVSGLLAGAAGVSLAGLRWNPLVIGDLVQVSWARDLGKLWYFTWAPFLALLLAAIPEDRLRAAWRSWFWTFGILSVVGIVQFYTGWPRRQPIPDSEGRFHATLFIGHHLSVASIWIFPFFAAVAAGFSRIEEAALKRLSGVGRNVLRGFAALGLVTLFLGFSRMLWIALPLGLALLFWLQLRRERRLVMTFGIPAVLAATAVLLYQLPVVRMRVEQSIGIGDRFELWKANLELFYQRPLFGVGWHHNLELAGQLLVKKYPGQEVFVGHAHNNFLDVLAGMGLFGAVSWLLWNGWLGRELWRLALGGRAPSLWVRDVSRGWLAAFVVFHLNGLTQVNFWEGKVQHQLFFVVAWVLCWRRSNASTLATRLEQC